MVTLLLTVACACAPDESGKHPLELAIEAACTPDALPRVLSIRTPCPYKEADAIDRLGVVTCISVIHAIRRGLSGQMTFSLARADVTKETEGIWERVVTSANTLRAKRRKAALPGDSMINMLLSDRLSRLWPAHLNGPAGVHFALSEPPLVQLIYDANTMATFIFEKARSGWRWRLRKGLRPVDMPLASNLEHALDEILPTKEMQGARLLARQQKVQVYT